MKEQTYVEKSQETGRWKVYFWNGTNYIQVGVAGTKKSAQAIAKDAIRRRLG